MRIVIPPALLLAACHAQPVADEVAAASPPHAAASASPAPPAETPAMPGELKTFGDWAVGCDNGGLCTMASLGGDPAPFPEVTMAILRQPGPRGAIDLSFDVPGDDAVVTPVAVRIDGRRIALPALNGPAATAVARAIAGGRTLVILDAGDRERARVSLAGAAASLRWIDARQGRAGTVSALVATGPRSASAVPAGSGGPVIAAVVPTGAAPARPTAAQLAAMRRRAACEDGRMATGDVWQPEVHALGGGATLVLLPCSAGAYNLVSTLFVLRGDRVEPARTDAPTGLGPASDSGLASVVNGAWREGELTSFAKARGLGDCGVRQSFVWDGARLRLTEQSEMGECRGNPNYIVTWRAQVVRR